MVAITYECPNCHWHQGHVENCPSWYEQPRTEQPASAAGSESARGFDKCQYDYGDGILCCVYRNCHEVGIYLNHSFVEKSEQPPAPAAQETGEWRVDGKGYAEYGARVPVRIRNSQDHVVAEVFQIETAQQIVRDHNEHQSLSAERERLREVNKQLVEALRRLGSHGCWCVNYVGGEHEPECNAAKAALEAVTALNEQGKELE